MSDKSALRGWLPIEKSETGVKPKKIRAGGKSRLKVDGYVFPNEAVYEFYIELKKRKLEFAYKPKYNLLDVVTYRKLDDPNSILLRERAIKAVTYTPHFEVTIGPFVHVVDVKKCVRRKGSSTYTWEARVSMIKLNMLRRALYDQGKRNYDVFFLQKADASIYWGRVDKYLAGETEHISVKFQLTK